MMTVSQRDLDQEAKRIAEASATREAQLTPEHQLAAWWLGVHLGYVSQYLSSFGFSDASVRQQARLASTPRMKDAQALADFLGIGPVYALESSTLAQFSDLPERIEADEGSVGARIAARTTLRHEQLYLMGMHVGATLASIHGQGWRGGIAPSEQIARHATLAGVPRAQWEPLTRLPSGATQAEVVKTYEAETRAVHEAILRANVAATK